MENEHLVILGVSERLWQLAGQLKAAGVPLTYFSAPQALTLPASGELPSPPPTLILLEAESREELAALTSWTRAAPWILLCPPQSQDFGPLQESELMVKGYEAGGVAALPSGSPDDVVIQAVVRGFSGESRPKPTIRPRQRHYPAGAGIPLHPGELLRVASGVVAQIAWHQDGTEGLVGLWGPGHLLPGHPEDSCCLAIKAHTDVTLEIHPLPDADPISDGLLERSRLLEAWSAMQSRPSMEQRLLGVLELLAEQFGRPESDGTAIDIRVTHAQLAAAIGATRATVTRLLGPLRRQGLVSTVTSESGERLFLPHWRGGDGHGIGR